MSTMMVGHRPHNIPSFTAKQMMYEMRSSSPDDLQPTQQPPQDEAILAITAKNSSHYTAFLLPQNDTQGNSEKALGYGAFGVVWSVLDPRNGEKVALKRIPRVFHNTITAKRVYRELSVLCHLKHDNIVSLTDIVKSDSYGTFNEIYLLCEFMQTDLHKIIVSPQPLSTDHVKIFVYQILRGVKYLHSARIIHRDIKPGNMLVNSNCLLKICDFGLARVEDPNEESSLTQEVVTQYYRPPELLMEVTRYSYAVDIWSVGCTLAELLSRRILFMARGPLEQLELIMNLTGTPSVHDLHGTHPDARCYVLSRKPRHPNLAFLYTLGNNITDHAVHLLSLMLKFNPDSRISAAEALSHPYIEEARLRFHSCMCSCCRNVPAPATTPAHAPASPASSSSSTFSTGSSAMSCDGEPTSPSRMASSTSSSSSSSASSPVKRKFCREFDPVCPVPLPVDLDAGFKRLSEAKKNLWQLISAYHKSDERPYRVTLNRNAKNYNALINSSVAQAKEAPSSHRWQ